MFLEREILLKFNNIRTVFNRNIQQYLQKGRVPTYKFYELFSKYFYPGSAQDKVRVNVDPVAVNSVAIEVEMEVNDTIFVPEQRPDILVIETEENGVEFITQLMSNDVIQVKTNHINNERKWEEEEEIRVIDFFFQNNCLWNAKHADYYKRSRSSLLDIIVEELNFKFSGNMWFY